MTGKSPQQTGKNPPIDRDSAAKTTDHSNYRTDKHNGTQKKSTIEGKNPFILSSCITNST